MNRVIGFIMAVWFSVLSLLGIPFISPDLDSGGENTAVATAENIELFEIIFEKETQWLASIQLENGAIPMTYAKSGELTMNPYFADFAALALLDNAEKYAYNVVKYMDWHFAHLNTAKEDFNNLDGTIYDYIITMEDGKIINERVSDPENADSYDTTDSYAATFLTVVYKYLNKTGDLNYIVSHAEELMRIANILLVCEQNGLTYAKPNHKIKYLMDNCEVYEGAVAAARLFKAIDLQGDAEKFSALTKEYDALALKVKENINYRLWNFVGGYYRPGITAYVDIPTKIFSWNIYYPQATSQLFPIICGVIEPDTDRAKSLYSQFSDSYHWQAFDYPDVFYWGANVYAAAVMNDLDSVVEYMENYLPLTEEHSWPLYNMDIARTSMAAYIMLERNK